MLDAVLDDLATTFDEILTMVRELDTHLGEAHQAFLGRLGDALYRLGYRLQGEEYEPEDRE
jgi:hypothetical protein